MGTKYGPGDIEVLEGPYVPEWHPVANADEMFWFGTTTTLFRAQLTDSMFHADARYQGGPVVPFAVTRDAIPAA